MLFIVVIDRKTWCVTINIQRSHQRSRPRLLRQHKGQGMQQNATQRCHAGESLKLKLKADCFDASDEVTWASQTQEINSFNVTSCETLRIAELWSFLPECWHPIGRLGTPSCTLQAVLDLRKGLYALLELLTCCGVLLQFAQALLKHLCRQASFAPRAGFDSWCKCLTMPWRKNHTNHHVSKCLKIQNMRKSCYIRSGCNFGSSFDDIFCLDLSSSKAYMVDSLSAFAPLLDLEKIDRICGHVAVARAGILREIESLVEWWVNGRCTKHDDIQ